MARRYFTESKSGIKPGFISEELRNALGISKKSLPVWIHRMRILGYPPGWLKKADMTNTTIDFLNGDDDVEEGQINNEEKKTYNTDSFHEYPGFNAPVPNGVKDDYEKLGMPPMQDFQQLNYAKKTVQSLQPVPHRRSKFTDVKNKNEDNNSSSSDESSDKETKTEQSTCILDTSQESSSVKALDSTINLSSELDETKGDESDEDSFSDPDEIISLDIEKRVLSSKSKKKNSNLIFSPVLDKSILNTNVEECTTTETETKLSESESKNNLSDEKSNDKPLVVSTDPTIIVTTIVPKEEDKLTELKTESNDKTNKLTDQDERTNKNNQEHQDNQNTKIDDNQNAGHQDAYQYEEETTSKITLVSMGAPVPAALNGEKPPLENFAVGMGELIYFENLPTSTGVFDKMRKVIKKVRKKLSSSSNNLNASSSSLNSTSTSNQNASTSLSK